MNKSITINGTKFYLRHLKNLRLSNIVINYIISIAGGVKYGFIADDTIFVIRRSLTPPHKIMLFQVKGSIDKTKILTKIDDAIIEGYSHE